ncbi:molybdate ABC transporter substrate-binding protein [Pseudohongiella sp.]|uniref:Molybdate ABC transporter substrate-binding protein n=1 Tax=marine sediment metagenome TaxID=412755 RepID=A0A0F9VJZ6_9ZZZZ|nr:molybdate ABC transporter substrate-binding protein [Pseudohongiella sp.]HDZ10363.1 molybdate ABC transporter substrate-binding protein [Pseudohongiella sp.]HEA62014.1 molybdate ABC transporter substrate-binding protein [Pseudohongiella sp.]
MKLMLTLLLSIGAMLSAPLSYAQQMTIAAASSLRPTLDRVVAAYKSEYPQHDIVIIYGASGRLTAQILNGAPFDFFMSADMDFPRRLADEGAAATEPQVYAKGRIALWSFNVDASAMTLQDLGAERIGRVAIAQPTVAPYGQRAREAMQAVGVWDDVEDKLVFGENISQVAQMAQSGAADVGIIALSLVRQPELAARGYTVIDAALHQPLEQGYVVTRRGADNAVAATFTQFLSTPAAQAVFRDNGFDVDD